MEDRTGYPAIVGIQNENWTGRPYSRAVTTNTQRPNHDHDSTASADIVALDLTAGKPHPSDVKFGN